MHNLHYVVVEADSGEEACSSVESAIESWGDENNWRAICGAVSGTDVVFGRDDGRWDIADLNQVLKNVNDWVFGTDEYSKKSFEESIQKLHLGEQLNSMDWYYIQKYAEEMSDKASALGNYGGNIPPKTTFDVFKDEYRSWKLDECGVTHIGDLSKATPDRLWVVAVDMHS